MNEWNAKRNFTHALSNGVINFQRHSWAFCRMLQWGLLRSIICGVDSVDQRGDSEVTDCCRSCRPQCRWTSWLSEVSDRCCVVMKELHHSVRQQNVTIAIDDRPTCTWLPPSIDYLYKTWNEMNELVWHINTNKNSASAEVADRNVTWYVL